MSKIKVMNVIWSMNAGGAQQIVLNYLKYFKNDPQIDFVLYVYTSKTQSIYDRLIEENGYNVVYLNNPKTKLQIPYLKRRFQANYSRRIWREAIKECNPDIIHVHISPLLGEVLDGIVDNNIPVRFDSLHSDPRRFKGKILKYITKAFQEDGFIPICLTQEQVKLAKKCYGIEEHEVLHNGINIEKIKKQIVKKETARTIWKINEAAFLIVAVGRLNPIKNFDLLIEIMAHPSMKKKNVKLLIAGDGSERKHLQQLIDKNCLENKVELLGNVENVIQLYCAADVVVIPSISESVSLVLLEAQVCEKKCVISSGIPKESIYTNKCLCVSENASVEEWIDKIFQSEEYEDKKSDIECYDNEKVCSQLKRIYIKYWDKYDEEGDENE